MHPIVTRISFGLSAILADVLFVVTLITVGNESESHIYLCKGNSTNGTCWNWNFDSSCMFDLLFISTICLHVAIFIFFTSSFLKCLFPELAFVAQRSLFFRCAGRYFSVFLNFVAFVVAIGLVVSVGIHDSSDASCHDTGHLWTNCKTKQGSCWVFAILCVGCFFSCAGLFLSAKDARMMYLGRQDFEEQEKIYQRYIDYDAVRDLDSF